MPYKILIHSSAIWGVNLPKNYNMTRLEITSLFEQRKNRHLIQSIALDALGMFTYIIPILGEFGDLIYAPIYGITIFAMYRLRVASAALGGVAGFAEELLPGTDFIPTASVMWAYHYYFKRESTLKKFVDQNLKEEELIEGMIDAHYRPKPPGLWKRVMSSLTVLLGGTSSQSEDPAEDALTLSDLEQNPLADSPPEPELNEQDYV